MNAVRVQLVCAFRGAGIAVLAFVSLLWVAGCAHVAHHGADAAAPKNIIIMFGDGAAATQWEFGRYSSRELRNQSFAVTDVVFKNGALGLLTVHSADSFVTDSAAAATAMSTGHKTNNFMAGVTPDGKPVRTLMEAARAAGKRIGIVSTAAIHDASPTAFSVHSKSRNDAQTIVDQYLALEPDVIMGGGRDFFLPKGEDGGKRTDGKDIVAAFAAKGYQVVEEPGPLRIARGPRLLGLFADADMDAEIDRDRNEEPSLAEMTLAAIRVLARNSPNGFVLFVESEGIDTAGHRNDIAALMRELWAFDDAVQIALDFQRRRGETLIVVTGDHESGGLSVTYALKDLTSSGTYISPAKPQLEMIARIRTSIGKAAERLGRKPSPELLDQVIAESFPGFTLDGDLRAAILERRPLERNAFHVPHAALGRMIARQTGAYWGTSGHTTEPVLVGALGPGAAVFRGYMDNIDFAKALHKLIDAKPSQ